MRSSKRDHILDSALRVVADEGVSAVTFEAVAHASGVTRGGLLYHFPEQLSIPVDRGVSGDLRFGVLIAV